MELASLRFDTYKAITLLKEQGFNKKQSEGIVEVMQQVAISGVATKQDVHDLKQDIRDLELRVEKLDIKIDTRIDELRSYITSRIYIGQAAAVVTVIGALKLFGVIG